MTTEYSLVALGTGKPRSWTAVRSLTHAELDGYRTRVRFLRGLVAARIPFRNMLQAHEAFLRHASSLEQGDLARLAGRPQEEWLAPLNRSLDGVLTAMRGYVDQTRFRLSHGGADEAPALALWDTSRRARHKRSAAYRVAYALRDYVRHGRPALMASHVTASWDPTTNTGGYTFTLACNRDALLESGFDWKGVRADLEALPPTFDPRPNLREAVGELAELDHELFSHAADRISEAISWIEALLGQADGSGDPSKGTVAKMEPGDPHPPTGARTFKWTFIEPPSKVEWP